MSVEVNWPGSRIEQEPQYRLVTDEQIAKWDSNAKDYVEINTDTLDFDTLKAGKWKYTMKYDSDGNMINPVNNSKINEYKTNTLNNLGNIKEIYIDCNTDKNNNPECYIRVFTDYNNIASKCFFYLHRTFSEMEIGEASVVNVESLTNITTDDALFNGKILINDVAGSSSLYAGTFYTQIQSFDDYIGKNDDGSEKYQKSTILSLFTAEKQDTNLYELKLNENGLDLSTKKTFGASTFKFVVNGTESNITTDKLTITGSNKKSLSVDLANNTISGILNTLKINDGSVTINGSGGFQYFDAGYKNGPLLWFNPAYANNSTSTAFTIGQYGKVFEEVVFSSSDNTISKKLYISARSSSVLCDVCAANQYLGKVTSCFPGSMDSYGNRCLVDFHTDGGGAYFKIYSAFVQDYIYSPKGLYKPLTINLNGSTYTYRGAMDKDITVSINASTVGAAPKSHTHKVSEITDINPSAIGAVSDTATITDWNNAIKAGYYNSDFGALNTPNPDDTTVTSYGGHVVVGKYYIEQTVFTDAVKKDNVISRPESIYQYIRYGKVIVSDDNTTYDWTEWYAIQYILPNA